MLQRIHYFFWLALFAVFIPSQALAYSESVDTSHQTVVTVLFNSVANDESQVFDFSAQNDLTEQSSPVSESFNHRIVPAIVNLSRIQLSEIMTSLDTNHGDVPHLDSHDPAYRSLAFDLPINQWLADRLYRQFPPSSHRLSGWKETNAMYVALNSHF